MCKSERAGAVVLQKDGYCRVKLSVSVALAVVQGSSVALAQ